MGGPAYDYDGTSTSRTKWPAYYDGVPLFYEWTRDYIKEFRLDRRDGDVDGHPPGAPSLVVDNPMDMEFGPDGALYVLEYGDGYFAENPDAQLVPDRLRARQPHADPEDQRPTPTVGQAPLTVALLQRRHDRPGR